MMFFFPFLSSFGTKAVAVVSLCDLLFFEFYVNKLLLRCCELNVCPFINAAMQVFICCLLWKKNRNECCLSKYITFIARRINTHSNHSDNKYCADAKFSFTQWHSFIPKSAALLIRPQSRLAVDRAVACLAYLSPEVSQARWQAATQARGTDRQQAAVGNINTRESYFGCVNHDHWCRIGFQRKASSTVSFDTAADL